VQSASECKHFVYLSIQNGTYVMVCELVQRRRVPFVTKLSFYCEYKREGRNSIIHKCFCQELDLKVFGGERVEKKNIKAEHGWTVKSIAVEKRVLGQSVECAEFDLPAVRNVGTCRLAESS